MLEIRKKGLESFYYFCRAIMGNDILHWPLHLPLCEALQGIAPGFHEWRELMLCGFRGCLKSTIMRYYIWWCGLYEVYEPDWNCIYVEQKSDNAVAHHILIQNIFRVGPQAEFLQELYQDRIPHGFAGWNSERTILVRQNPAKEPFITVGALEMKLEGIHRDAIIIDDPEGADADKSQVPNREALKFLEERSEPLLNNPSRGRKLLGLTPHGHSPLAYTYRRMDGAGSLDNTERVRKKLWWMPVVDKRGKSRWPQRMSQEWVEAKVEAARLSSHAKRMWEMQYLLLERSSAVGMFDMTKIESNRFTLLGSRLIRYPTQIVDARQVTKDGFPLVRDDIAHIDMSHLRYYMHLDPGHKDPKRLLGGDKPSKWAIEVVGVSPDAHAFPVEEFVSRDVTFDQYVNEFFRLYRKYLPFRFTIDPVGAQTWFGHVLENMETTRYRGMTPIPTIWRPDRRARVLNPSSVLEEAHKGGKEKEAFIMSTLELPHNMGWLHLNPDLTPELWREHDIFGSTGSSFDALDALAQGPGIWRPAASPQSIQAMRLRKRLQAVYQVVEPVTGYYRPWKEKVA